MVRGVEGEERCSQRGSKFAKERTTSSRQFGGARRGLTPESTSRITTMCNSFPSTSPPCFDRDGTEVEEEGSDGVGGREREKRWKEEERRRREREEGEDEEWRGEDRMSVAEAEEERRRRRGVVRARMGMRRRDFEEYEEEEEEVDRRRAMRQSTKSPGRRLVKYTGKEESSGSDSSELSSRDSDYPMPKLEHELATFPTIADKAKLRKRRSTAELASEVVKKHVIGSSDAEDDGVRAPRRRVTRRTKKEPEVVAGNGPEEEEEILDCITVVRREYPRPAV